MTVFTVFAVAAPVLGGGDTGLVGDAGDVGDTGNPTEAISFEGGLVILLCPRPRPLPPPRASIKSQMIIVP